ncbi:MAG: hypothetical protein JRF33_08140 [Deltaproteobacteria bacterium]|nr:hypothetical protein [Deltaproteobacteria bacterium]
MDWNERLKQRVEVIRHLRPSRIAPTVSIRKDLQADLLGDEEETRLARLCKAAYRALDVDPLFAGRYDGKLRLKLLEKGPVLKVGKDGGQRWMQLDHMDSKADLDVWRKALVGKGTDFMDRVREQGRAGLEILDLSCLGVRDWRGVVASPQVARLVLLAAIDLPAGRVHPVVLDFDHKLSDAGRAARFIDALSTGLDA